MRNPREKPSPAASEYIYYVAIVFSTPAVLKMIEFDCKQYDQRDRELIPSDWDIEATTDHMGGCSVTFKREDGGVFDPEEVQRVCDAVTAIEQTYWQMTREKKP